MKKLPKSHRPLGCTWKTTPGQIGSSVTFAPLCFAPLWRLARLNNCRTALCKDTKILVQVTSSAFQALLRLHVSCWAARPPQLMSPGLAKSPTTSMLVFYSSNIPQRIQAKPVTTAAVVVALTKVRPPCSWSLWAQKMDGKSCTVGLAAFFTWICPQEVWFRRWERCAVSVGKECCVFFPTLPKLAGKQLHGFPCPKAETDLPWWREGRTEGVNDLPSFILSVVTFLPWITIWQIAMGAPPPHYSPNISDAASPQIYPDHLNTAKKHRNICMMAILCSAFAPS